MYYMRPIATGDFMEWYVSQSACLSVTRLWPAKTSEGIEVLFGVENFGDPRNIVLDVSPDSPTERERQKKSGETIAHCPYYGNYINTAVQMVPHSMLPSLNYFSHLLDCIECMRCWLFLPMFALSICQSVCLSRGLNRWWCVQCMPRAVCAGSFSAVFAKCLWPLVLEMLPMSDAWLAIQVEHDCSFFGDLGADSFMFMELVYKIEDEFGRDYIFVSWTFIEVF